MKKVTHLIIILVVTLSLTLGILLHSYVQAIPSVALVERAPDGGGERTEKNYKLSFLGYSINPDLTVTFRYKIQAYGEPIDSWALFSECFVKGALVGASEPVVFKQSIHCLRFIREVEPNEERIVTFTLRTGYYTSFKIGKIDYYVLIGSKYFYGRIKGPTPND